MGAPALALLLATAPGLAQAEETRQFSIEPGPLADAIIAYGQQAGRQVSYQPAIAQGLRSPGASGAMAPEEALTRLLAGTGLASRTDGRTITLAQLPPAPSGTVQLPEIGVTAGRRPAGFVPTEAATGTKTDTALIETPQSISVIPRQQMDVQGVQSVPQALRYTPGVLPEYRGAASRNDLIYSRGFGGLTNLEFLDGLRLITGSFSYPQIDQYNLERIEVLRGPASVLYGQNVPGGLVNLVSRRPPSTPYHEVRLDAGSNQRVQGAFDVGGPIDAEGRFLYRLTGLARDSATQVSGSAREQRLSIAPALTWRPSEATTLTLLASYQHDPRSGYYGFLPAQGTVFPNRFFGRLPTSFFEGEPGYDRFERTQYAIGYQFEHRFDETWTVRQNARYMHIDSDYRSVFGQGLQANGYLLNRSAQDSVEALGGITVDNQVEARFATGPVRHTLLAGLDYQRLTLDQVRHSGTVAPLDLRNPVYGTIRVNPPLFQSIDLRQNQTGLYVQDQLRLDRWVLTFGGRSDWFDSTTDNRLTGRTTRTSDQAFTGRAGLVYLFDNGIAPYASYAESFQPATGTDFTGRPFVPTRGRQYEVGIKYQPPGYRSFVTVAAFDLVQQNVTTVDTVHPGFTTQTGEIRSRGVEVEARASLAEGLNVLATYTYLDNEVTRANDGTQGNRPALMPQHMAALWGDYTFSRGPLSGLLVGGGVRYVGPTFGDSANSFKVPGYTVADATIGYDFGVLAPRLSGLRSAVNISNLFDKEYVSGCTYAGGCYWGLRRTVLANLTYRW